MHGSGSSSRKLSTTSSVLYGLRTKSSYRRRKTFVGYFLAKIDANLTSASTASHIVDALPHPKPKIFETIQGRRNKGGKGTVALPIFLNYSSKDSFLPHKYYGNLVVCPTNI